MSVIDEQKIAEVTEKLARASENSTQLYDAGVSAGKKSEYDLFWDTYQNDGKRRYYERAFEDTTNGGRRWIYDATYRPKHPMKPLNAQNMYSYCRLPYSAIAEVDFSECTDFYSTFAYFAISDEDRRFPAIDMRMATRTQAVFAWSTGIKKIEEISVSEATPYQLMFNGTSNLEEIRFKGTIAQNGLDFKSCTKLSKESIEDVIEHLSDSTGGLTVTFSKVAVDKAYEKSEGANDGSDCSVWLDDKNDYKPNWTIALG